MSSVAKRILTGASLILLVTLLLYWNRAHPGGAVVWGVALALSALGAIEVSRMPGLAAPRLRLALLLSVAGVGAASWLARAQLTAPARPYLVWLVGALIAAPLAGLVVGRGRARAALLALWCAVPLFGLLSIDRVYGERGLACLVALSKVGDIFGYFVGRAIGKRHPFPRLSPGKTVAGCVASLVSGTVLGAVLAGAGALPDAHVGLLAGAAIGLALNLAAQAGDLLESRVKRVGGVKDSSPWVGPAGGVLDVVDSLLLSVPTALLVWPLLFDLGS